MLSQRKESYYGYLIKRICRIYIPYLVSLIVAISLSILIKNGNVTGLSDWFNQFWVRGLDLKIVIEHILLIVNIHTDAYNTVVWSLIHEMRISIIFPIIILCVMRWNWKINLIICFCLSTVGGLNDVFSFEERNGHYTSIFDTIHFTSFFILGSLIAKYRLYLVDTYKNLKRTYKWALLFISIVCYG
ncbi:acyltransferase family protein, partial [Streptomyces sp. NPDC002144]